ncbi:N-acetyl-gamma-glutamyl-phosphate reductase [Croceitalea dokdonensis DOKDO 023]|uniref:N-acetyl-gamma-glutamyl-phosphate reductase n=1 Tax=Croceitalea dokdonensis DOKDO 023 TaxID=1300341 RepID=A0A0P7A7F5_9FLAO|nr:N-acetyl-gamma-glutamyl-phosphate reductase [Croceitalea dokdonensis]KPM32713.1 N-acetyl-gamma-glutamyl-phosphate reductase [Croceitalea dokdonensis DOKDO 023]
MIKAGIIGSSGYTGGELIRLLLNHAHVDIDFVYSTTRGGQKLTKVHQDLLGQTQMEFSNTVHQQIDIVFLCLGHGNSTQFLKDHPFSENTLIIDLSNDFRLQSDAKFHNEQFVYGLPELNRKKIQSSRLVANPGCFATAIQLALLPLAASGLLQDQVHINAVTGSTGAGIKPSATTHFSWRNNNASWYKPFTHQHLGEIGESLDSFGHDTGKLYFLPNRGNFARGILATAYTRYQGSLEDASKLYTDFFGNALFTHVTEEPIHLKQVVNTNNCHIHLHQYDDVLLVTSAIDNLLKGASGQAVQNMNLMFGFDEDEGLRLKATAF